MNNSNTKAKTNAKAKTNTNVKTNAKANAKTKAKTNAKTNANAKTKTKAKIYKTTILFIIFDLFAIAGFIIMYGPWSYIRNLYITTAMQTMKHQYLAKVFYNDKSIEKIMDSNYFVKIEEDVNIDAININTKAKVKYKDKYEEELLTREYPEDLYKIINLKVGSSNGYLVAIYAPEKVKLIALKKFNSVGHGEKVVTMCNRYNGVVCINGGGFEDQGYGSDIPIGTVIQNGEITWGRENADTSRDDIIGVTKDGKLKLMANATANEALKAGINDAMVFGPFLIVNGKPLNIVGDPWGKAPRVAIAQRKDGVMMFLVVDGENYINGASLQDMIDILQRYGAYNAANLDGGQSASLTVKGKLYNVPPPEAKKYGGRYVVTGWGLIP